MYILFALSFFVLEASVLGSPLKQDNERKIPFQLAGIKTRIVGGVEVTPHSIPYQVALIIDNNGLCGGVLISTRYVLTVAHCTYNVKRVEVILGAHNIFCDEDTQVIISNPTIINHLNYSELTLANDISLLKLPWYISLTSAIKPISSLAPNNSDDYVGHTGRIFGWGFLSSSSQVQSKLRRAYVEIIKNQRCRRSAGNPIPNSNMCTRGYDELIGPVGACSGDSGGPLVIGNELVGLISYGDTKCEALLPTVYTRISYHREWIAKHSGV